MVYCGGRTGGFGWREGAAALGWGGMGSAVPPGCLQVAAKGHTRHGGYAGLVICDTPQNSWLLPHFQCQALVAWVCGGVGKGAALHMCLVAELCRTGAVARSEE